MISDNSTTLPTRPIRTTAPWTTTPEPQPKLRSSRGCDVRDQGRNASAHHDAEVAGVAIGVMAAVLLAVGGGVAWYLRRKRRAAAGEGVDGGGEAGKATPVAGGEQNTAAAGVAEQRGSVYELAAGNE
jgi:hypothetical protein